MEGGNRLRVGVRAKNASVSGVLRVGPSKALEAGILKGGSGRNGIPHTPVRGRMFCGSSPVTDTRTAT